MIIVRLQHENVATRWTCCVCGGQTDKHDIYAVAFRDTGEELGHVCEQCEEAGPEALRQRALEWARKLRAEADSQEKLAKELAGTTLPTAADRRAADKQLYRFFSGQIDELPLPGVHTPLEVNGKSVPVILQK